MSFFNPYLELQDNCKSLSHSIMTVFSMQEKDFAIKIKALNEKIELQNKRLDMTDKKIDEVHRWREQDMLSHEYKNTADVSNEEARRIDKRISMVEEQITNALTHILNRIDAQ